MENQNASHFLLDLRFEKYPKQLDRVEFWQELGREVLALGKFSVLEESFHEFKPQGVSGFWLLSESHLSFHTWPEKGAVFVDLFSCGGDKRSQQAIGALVERLEKIGGRVYDRKRFKRGFAYKE